MTIAIKSDIVSGSKAQRFREGGRLHRNVRIYLDAGDASEFEPIASVEYELHPTFRDRRRTSTNRTRGFEIRIWTYGFFKVRAQLTRENGRAETISGFVRWPADAQSAER